MRVRLSVIVVAFVIVSFFAMASVVRGERGRHGSQPPIPEAVSVPFEGSWLIPAKSSASRGSLILLHGSEGGSAGSLVGIASRLAEQGYTVLIYCYFDCSGPAIAPRGSLKSVEISTLLKAVRWLKKRARGDERVALYGFSRGAELALLAGALSGDFFAENAENLRPDAIIAHAPSDTTKRPFNRAWQEPACWVCSFGSGLCSGLERPRPYRWNPACGPDNPETVQPDESAWTYRNHRLRVGEPIPIERFAGPILLTHGLDDEVWPAEQTRRLHRRLTRSGRGAHVAYFENAGHVFENENEGRRQALVEEFLARHVARGNP